MNINRNNALYLIILSYLVVFSPPTSGDTHVKVLSLHEAITMAHSHDPWLQMSQAEQSKLEATAIAESQLNDPTISFGLANIGADRFDFNQEQMTQFRVGVTQRFPRGKTRAIKKERFRLMANEQPILRKNRLALLTKQVSLYWLDAYKAKKSIHLIENDRPLFEQLIDLVEASYASGIVQTRQQDLTQAQLELSRLEDRLSVLNQAFDYNYEQLNGLISDRGSSSTLWFNETNFVLKNQLPNLIKHDVLNLSNTELYSILSKHPVMETINVQIEAERKGVELAQQKYKPAWGLNASYGYRDNADNGIRRADLFSVGVSFELPLFTKNRQDQEVKAAAFSVDAKESKRSLMLREMASTFTSARSELIRLDERKSLYSKTLLPQMSEQANSTLNAYTHDDGDFAEVIRARITELNAQLDALAIEVDIAKANVKINYLMTGLPSEGEEL